jgi:ubiquitin
MVIRLCGGKKKRKKKIYTKPKKIKHKHRKRPKALLEYFNVDNTGKISKLKIECEKCPAGKCQATIRSLSIDLYFYIIITLQPLQTIFIIQIIRYLHG